MPGITMYRHGGLWNAHIVGDDAKWGHGTSQDAAVGNLVRRYPELFNIDEPLPMTDEQVKKLGGLSLSVLAHFNVNTEPEPEEIEANCSICTCFSRIQACNDCHMLVCDSNECYDTASGLCVDCQDTEFKGDDTEEIIARYDFNQTELRESE